MTLQDLLAQADNDGTLDQIAQQLGVDREVARQGMAQLTPAVARGLQRNASQGAGIEDLLGSLLGGAGGGAGAGAAGGALGANGNDILGQIFGSKDVSRNVAGYAADRSGLDSALLKRMLPLIASLAVTWLSQRGGQAAAADGGPITSGGLRGGLPGQAPAAGSGSMFDSLNQMLDQDGDGSAVDDLLNMARKYF